MSIISLILISLIVSILAVLLKQTSPAYSVLLISAYVIILLFIGVNWFYNSTENILGMVDSVEYASDFLKILIKAIIICILSDVTSNICRDAGSNSVAVCIDVVTKIILLSLALPIADKLVEIIKGLFNI